MRFYAFVDGGCYNNGSMHSKAYGSFKLFPVPDATAAPSVWKDQDAKLEDLRFPLSLSSKRDTNNTAEAQALQHLLVCLYNAGVLHPNNHITIHSDSLLILNQIQGVWKTNNRQLLTIYKNIYRLLDKFEREYHVEPFKVLKLKKISGDLMKEILGH